MVEPVAGTRDPSDAVRFPGAAAGAIAFVVALAGGAPMRVVLPLPVTVSAAVACGLALGALALVLPRRGWAVALQVLVPGVLHLLALAVGALAHAYRADDVWTALLEVWLLVPAVLATWAVALLGVVGAVVVLHLWSRPAPADLP